GVDPTLLSKALADDVEVDETALENDPELLAELSGLIGGSEEEEPANTDATASRPPNLPSPSSRDAALISKLRGLVAVYDKMLAASAKEGNNVKQRRHQRTVDKLRELIIKAERGESVDETEIPPSPPSFATSPNDPILPSRQAPAPPALPTSQPPPVPRRSTSGIMQESIAESPTIPQRTSSSCMPVEGPERSADSRKDQVLKVLKRRRRDAYVANGKAAVAAMDKSAAKQYF
ncbi:hypothetical protein OSTOST_03489, partial [Ostertagia ostertagi]